MKKSILLAVVLFSMLSFKIFALPTGISTVQTAQEHVVQKKENIEKKDAELFGIYGNLTYSVSNGEITITNCVESTEGSITIPSVISGRIVTAIGDSAFKDCQYITKVVIPDSVTTLGSMAFYNCKNLFDVVIGNGVTEISGWAFSNCTRLESVIIGNSVKRISINAFEKCSELADVIIPDSVMSIGLGAFSYCTKLKSITIGNSLKSIEQRAFEYCAGLKSVYIKDIVAWCNISFSDATSRPLYYAGELYLNDELLTDVVIPDSVTNLDSCPFEYCASIKSVTLPCGITSVCKNSFNGCSGLESISVPGGVIEIADYAFNDCYSLKNITIPGGVTSIGSYAFNRCLSLESIIVPDSVKNIGNYCFKGCYSLETVKLSNSITSIGVQTFYGCSSLEKLLLPDGVTGIDFQAFYNCTSLESVAIPESVESIGGQAFENCKKLTSVYITNLTAWCNIIFDNYSSNPLSSAQNLYLNEKLVSNIVIPNSVSSIGAYSFYNCKSAVNVTIHDSVTSIGSYAFYDCPATRHYQGSSIQWSQISNPSNYTAICKFSSDYIFLDGKTQTFADEELEYRIHFSSSYNNDYLISTIKYPKFFTFVEIKNNDFADNSIDLQYSDEEYNYITVYSTYSFNGERTKKYEGYIPYSIVFKVDKNCPIGIYSLCFVDETVAIGDKDYAFINAVSDIFVSDVLTIYGDDVISESTQYTVKGINSTDVPVIWSVDNQDVATVNAEGIVTPIIDGSITLKAAYTDNNEVFAQKTITIIGCNVTDIEIIGDETVYDGGEYFAKIFPEKLSHKMVTWSVDDDEVATITSDGVLIAKKAGTVNIKATVNDTTGFSKEKTVTIPSINAVINSISTDAGIWDKDFVSYKRNYTIVVPNTTEIVTFTGSFTDGLLKCNDVPMFNGREKTFELTGNNTVFTFTRSNVSGQSDSTYTVIVKYQIPPGDATGDGQITNRDAARILQYVAGWDIEIDLDAADVTGDGTVNNRDAARILQYVAGWDVTLD